MKRSLPVKQNKKILVKFSISLVQAFLHLFFQFPWKMVSELVKDVPKYELNKLFQ